MVADMNTTEKAGVDEKIEAPNIWFGKRHAQYILFFLLLSIGYAIRTNMSVAIVAMNDPDVSPNTDVPTYNWTDQSIVLSSFFWGYVITQVLAGHLAGVYGPKWFLVGTFTVCSLASLFVPLMASSFGSKGVMACRIIQGLTQGFIYPSMHNLQSKWIPLPERSRISTIIYAGGPFGTVIASPVTGWISASWIGWPPVFYIFGSIGLCWAAAFALFGVNSPMEHKTISLEERNYIQRTLGAKNEKEERRPTPWKAIFTSPPFWAILVAHCGQNWGYWTLQTETPTYMKNILNFDMESNGLLSAAPYLCLWLFGFVFSPISDYMIARGFSTGFVRKIMQTIGVGMPGLALIWLGFVNEDQKILAVVLLIAAVGFNAAIFSGYNCNHIDLSPTYSGTLMGITNAASNVFSILGPILVQYIVVDLKNVDQWQIVFFVAAAIYLGTDVFYIFFGQGVLQPWEPIYQNQHQAVEGFIGGAIALIILGYVPAENKALALSLLIIAVGLNASMWSGFNINHIDLAPNYAGELMGLTNSIGNILSICAPLACQFIITEHHDLSQWQTVFFVAALVYIAADIFYVIFADGEVQPWNERPTTKDTEAKSNTKEEEIKQAAVKE